jgi:hypothetical protein
MASDAFVERYKIYGGYALIKSMHRDIDYEYDQKMVFSDGLGGDGGKNI